MRDEQRRAMPQIGRERDVTIDIHLDDVKVDWIVTSSTTPLIVVIALSFALGAVVGWVFGQLRKKRKT